jgi:hypothetical protein
MGTCSYVLTGTDQGFQETFGSTCHGAGAPQELRLCSEAPAPVPGDQAPSIPQHVADQVQAFESTRCSCWEAIGVQLQLP